MYNISHVQIIAQNLCDNLLFVIILNNYTLKNINFGLNLKTLRDKQPLRDLAKEVGISASTLSAYERHKGFPPIDIAISIAKHFNVSLEDIIFSDMQNIAQNNEPKISNLISKELSNIEGKTGNVSSNVSSNIEGKNTELLTKVLTKELTKFEGIEVLHSCRNEVARLEGLLAEKEELIRELRARINDKEKMVSMLEKQLKVHESTQNQQNESDNIRQTG